MIRFVSISAFRQAFDALLKVKRGVYANVPAEICKAFQNVTELVKAFALESSSHQVVIHDINDHLKELTLP